MHELLLDSENKEIAYFHLFIQIITKIVRSYILIV